MVYIMKNKLKYLPTTILTITTLCSGAILTGAQASADTTGTKPATVTVSPACSFASDSSYTSILSIETGTPVNTESDTSKTTVQMSCNGTNGFSLYAVGYSPDATHPTGLEGNTNLYSTVGIIPTGAPSASSYWSLKVSSATSTTSYSILSTYASYSAVPGTATPILSFTGPSTPSYVTGTARTDYQVYAAAAQPAGSYAGAVKYTVAVNS